MRYIHPIADAGALVITATFWLATVISELFGTVAMVVAVKTAIPWGLLLLVPMIALAGASGFMLAKKGNPGRLVVLKKKRMPFIAANGIVILIPAALFLASAARAHAFDLSFYVVQGLELAAGATNITLLALNMRDGLRLTGRLRRRASAAP